MSRSPVYSQTFETLAGGALSTEESLECLANAVHELKELPEER